MASTFREKGSKAVGLLSGGLDSTLAAKLILEQGVEIFAINFTSPFCTCTPKKSGCAAVITAVRQLGDVPLRRAALGDEYLDMVQNPKHGYGSGLNPCIDCRIMKIRKAGEYMHEIGASFLFTGEVLGQRPMSQHRKAIELIDRDSGLQGYILRPLSAAHFEPTIPEKRGWIDRSKLLGISGRSRKEQISLATEKGIRDYPCPAGGCLLTDKNFADRMGDYFTHTETASMKDIPFLKVGRHFRLENGDKVIVARNEQEGKTLKKMCPDTDHLLSPVNFSGPVVVLQGTSLEAAVEKMLEYTKRKISEDARIAHRYSAKSEILCLPRVPLPLIRQPKVVSAIPPH
jgi:tRNA U34 2-thiouridine synthase MnmA/TrmU